LTARSSAHRRRFARVARPTPGWHEHAPISNGGRGSIPTWGRVTLEEYAWQWLAERTNLRPRTRELYESELRLHILPALGPPELRHLTSGRVRSWHSEVFAVRPGRGAPDRSPHLWPEAAGRTLCAAPRRWRARPPTRPEHTTAAYWSTERRGPTPVDHLVEG
jgi:hypothetical protein